MCWQRQLREAIPRGGHDVPRTSTSPKANISSDTPEEPTAASINTVRAAMTVEQEVRVPGVDLRDFDRDQEAFLQQLLRASRDIGFFYVTGHGVDPSLIEEAFKAVHRLFDLPQETKDSFHKADFMKGRDYYIGYSSKKAGCLLHEAFGQIHEEIPRMRHVWPPEELLPGYRETMLKYMQAFHAVALKLMRAFALALKLPINFFDDVLTLDADNGTTLSNNHYPGKDKLTCATTTNRNHAHTDQTLITLLVPSPGSVGLELAAGRDGQAAEGQSLGTFKVDKWVRCDPVPGALVVNVGDLLEIWSDGVLRSNYHRVRQPADVEAQGDRYSLAYFLRPRLHDQIQGKSKSLPPITLEQYLVRKGKQLADSLAMGPAEYEASEAAGLANGLPFARAIAA